MFFNSPEKKSKAVTTEEITLHLNKIAEFIKKNKANLYDQNQDLNFDDLDSKIKHFNIKEPSHVAILNNAMEQYEEKLQKLKSHDITFVLSLTFALAASLLSPLLFGLGHLASAAGFFYAGMLFVERKNIQAEYEEAQQNMTNVYIWIMNDTKSNKSSMTTGNGFASEVIAMQKLYECMLSDSDITAFVCEAHEKGVVDAKNKKEDTAIEKQTTTKLQLSLNFLIYGKDQGSPSQVCKGLLALCGQTLMSVGISIKDAALSLTGYSQEEATAEFVSLSMR